MDLSSNSTKFPSKILYPLDFFPHSNAQHQAMVDDFVGVLEDFLGTKKIEFSIAERWDKCPPAEAQGKPLKQYLAKVCPSFYRPLLLAPTTTFISYNHPRFNQTLTNLTASERLLADVLGLLPRLRRLPCPAQREAWDEPL